MNQDFLKLYFGSDCDVFAVMVLCMQSVSMAGDLIDRCDIQRMPPDVRKLVIENTLNLPSEEDLDKRFSNWKSPFRGCLRPALFFGEPCE